MQTKLLLIAVSFSFFILSGSIHVAAQEKVSRIKIFIPVKDLKALRDQGIDFDHGEYNFIEQSYINSFPASDVTKIKKLGYKVITLIDDEVANFLKTNKPEDFYKYDKQPLRQLSPAIVNFQAGCQSYDTYITTPAAFTAGSRAGFYTLPELEGKIDQMVADYPGLVTKSSIGNSFQGRPIWVVKISKQAWLDQEEPEVLYTGLHHAREGMSMMNLVFYMQYLLKNYSTDSKIRELLDSRELFFIPCVNVDGYNYNTTSSNWSAGKRMRRKNMRSTGGTEASDGSGGYGVDLNRNYPKYWGYNTTGSSTTVTSDAYRGSAASSEPETIAMRTFINGRNFKIAVNYHCYGNWWIRPNGPAASATNLASADVAIYNSLANLFTRYNGYVYGNPTQTVYEVNGYSDDWLFSDDLGIRERIFAFSPEIGAASDGFWASTSRIIPLAKEQIFNNLQIAYSAGSYAEIQDTSGIDVNDVAGSFKYSVTRKGLVNAPITVSLIPLENILGVGLPVTLSSISTFLGTQAGSIIYSLPVALPLGARIRYIWRLETGGIMINDTITKFYKPIVVFSDDMENTATYSSRWQNGGTGVTWGYSSSYAFAGTRSLSESPASSYTSNANQTATVNMPLDLSNAISAYLSFLIRHSSENFHDRLQVEISTTGVNGTFAPICSRYTIKENKGSLGGQPAFTGTTDGWLREIIDLGSYVGNNNIALRFHFLSNGTTSQVSASVVNDGFYIDDLKVVKSNGVLLPVTMVSISARVQSKSVLIQWQAINDSNLDHYEVQRSLNGVDFVTIGRTNRSSDNFYTDHDPGEGKIYYRIKAMDINGNSKCSKEVAVTLSKSRTISYYPNPVRNVLNIEYNSEAHGSAIIELASLTGQVLYSKTHIVQKGINNFNIDMKNFPGQMYMLTVKGSGQQIMEAIKVVKQ